MCSVCHLVHYYERLAKTTQNILIGILDLIRRIIFAIVTCIFATIRLFFRVYMRTGAYFTNKGSCPKKTDCKLRIYSIMCTISCLLLIVVAFFIVVFHTKLLDNLFAKCENMSDVKRNTTGGNGTDQTGTEKDIIAQNGTESSSNETNTEIEEEQRTPETMPTTLKAITQTTSEDTMRTATEDTMQTTPEDTMQTTLEDTTQTTLEDTTQLTPEGTTQTTLEATTQTSPEDTTLETPEDTTLETPEDTTQNTPKDTTDETPEATTLETPEDITQTTPKDTTLETPEDTTLETPEDTTQTTLEATMQTTPEEQVITNSTEKSRLIRIGYDSNDNIKSDNINDFYEIREHSPNAYSDVKEFVKEKQSMSKVLSLLEEILKNMNSKKKFENLLLSNVIQTTPFDDPSIESIDDLPKRNSEELYVESGDNNFVEKMDDKIII